MTTDPTSIALASIMDSLALLREDLDSLAQGQERIERDHVEILTRLDRIDAGQGAVTDLLPVLELILARVSEDRIGNRAGIIRVAEIAAHAHAAAYGNRAPLPIDVADDPLLERFLIAQPADHVTNTRGLAEWRRDVGQLSSAELTTVLARQYQPSPTDTAATRVLRYQLAAISRAELLGRGATPPAPPRTTIAPDRSTEAQRARSKELADLWREGLSVALLAEPELVAALDLFASEGRRLGTKPGQASDALIEVYERIGDSIEAGKRSQGELAASGQLAERSTAVQRGETEREA